MAPHNPRTPRQQRSIALLMVMAILPLQSTRADDALEREQLAALVRQLNLVNRLADQAATASSGEPARYHFDYARLREDLQRVRAGVEDYLAPQRAQPRDPVPLTGSYSRDSGTEPQVWLP